MDSRTLHAVAYKSESSDDWVAFCVEYDITSSGDSEAHALEMLREAVELHLEGIGREQLEHIDNEVGSEPVLKSFTIRAPAILQ
jgi:predicted RNase H-like HicB family nuclease